MVTENDSNGAPPSVQYFTQRQAREWLPRLTAREHEVLDHVNQKVAAGESLEQIIEFVFKSTRDIFPCDRLGLSFLEDEGARVVAHCAVADYEPVLLKNGYAQDLRGSSLEVIIRDASCRSINDLAQYSREHPESASAKLLLKEGVLSSLTCPLYVNEKPVGFLFRSTRKLCAYGSREVAMQYALAERLAQAVEKAYRLEQLAAANSAYFEMLGFVSHELRSPLAGLVMGAEAILGNYYGPLLPDQRTAIEKLTARARKMIHQANEYLNLARIEGGGMFTGVYVPVNMVKDIINPVLESLNDHIAESWATVSVVTPSLLPELECEPQLIHIAIYNLVSNAIKYGHKSGAIEIKVESVDDVLLRISVENTGLGFPADQQSRLFRKFSRLQTPELLKRNGSGVGLYIVWRIVQFHKGRVWAESEPGKWARFTVELPLAKR